jgi:LysR family hydrogen peroxide-inducible transcriptional activator
MIRTPTIRQLAYLCAVSETKHFGNAARACHVSQSTLSAGINDLEQNLGMQLIERNNKNVLITPVGEEIVARARRILIEAEDLVALCQASKTPFSSKMRLGIIPTIAPFILPKLLKELRRLHPDFQLHIIEDLSEHLLEALRYGELDILLLALPYPAEAVEIQHLFYDDLVLAYYKDHPIGKLNELSTRDLKGEQLLLLEDGHCLRNHVLEACKLQNNVVAVPYRATSLNTIVQMVTNNIGITLLPQLAIDAKILSGTRVQIKRFKENNIWRSIGLMWRSSSARKREYQMLGEFIQKYIHSDHA